LDTWLKSAIATTIVTMAMGGLVNAMFWMLGPDQSENLLRGYTPTLIQNLWHKFVMHVNHVLRDHYLLKRLKTAMAIMDIDDMYPLVVHLKGTNNSQNHAVCVYNGHIYNLASRYVLIKHINSLNWCCGTYPYECQLRIYQVLPQVVKAKYPCPPQAGSKKKSRKRWD
jgi:hypothetical protein